MTTNVIERLWFVITNLYQSNATKPTEQIKAEPYISISFGGKFLWNTLDDCINKNRHLLALKTK